MFHNVNLSNLENALQRNLRTGQTRKSIFRAPRGTKENLKFSSLAATMVASSTVPYIYWSAQKNSRHITETPLYSDIISFYFSSVVTNSLRLFISNNFPHFNFINPNISLPSKFGPFVSATINETLKI